MRPMNVPMTEQLVAVRHVGPVDPNSHHELGDFDLYPQPHFRCSNGSARSYDRGGGYVAFTDPCDCEHIKRQRREKGSRPRDDAW